MEPDVNIFYCNFQHNTVLRPLSSLTAREGLEDPPGQVSTADCFKAAEDVRAMIK